MADEGKPGPLPLVDDPLAPEIFATSVSGFLNLGGSIAVTLECVKSDYETDPGTLRRFVTGRLILTIGSAQALAVGLFDFLKSQGLDPAAGPGGGSVQ